MIGLILSAALIAMMLCAGTVAVRHMAGMPWRSLLRSSSGGDPSVMTQADSDREYPREASPVDFNGNGVDDYADIVAGARADATNHPRYDSGYYEGGYPPDDRGACTDTVWRAFRQAGYDLKAMVDADIAADPDAYAAVAPKPDPNIDFRRTGVLNVFFAKYARTLTTDVADREQWQGGDIVVFETSRHIGVVSDKRDGDGTPYVIHNMGQRRRENDYLAFRRHMTVTGHYRFDASKVPRNVLRTWQE
ncbi:DUF1287 domain-containing protein [Bifidobacterium sp. 82T10]|uniref:DUF1287 domain-containing protein n=2 Tax=Bifidobacterium miconis TaxID=2834435 RepID=A0ABS6WEU8_9BIFI|nr:DUF1287 domain-containing protein [Bifidobacterium miconis]